MPDGGRKNDGKARHEGTDLGGGGNLGGSSGRRDSLTTRTAEKVNGSSSDAPEAIDNFGTQCESTRFSGVAYQGGAEGITESSCEAAAAKVASPARCFAICICIQGGMAKI